MKSKFIWFYLIFFGFSFSVCAQDRSDANPIGDGEIEEMEQEVQEVKYVTDKLRLSLYKEADSDSRILKLLVSGDELDVLQRSGPYSKVRTRAGLTGWVKNGFLVSTPTASFQLIEAQKENQKLTQQLEKYADSEKQFGDYENTIAGLQDDFAQLQQQLNQVQSELDDKTQANTQLQLQSVQQGVVGVSDVIRIAQQFWYFIAAACLALVLIGFISGRELIEARVRKRFQGVKVW